MIFFRHSIITDAVSFSTHSLGSPLKWKSISTTKNGCVQQIEKLDNYDGVSAPMLRFRSSFEGLGISDFVDRYLVALNTIFQADECLERVEEIHSIHDTETIQKSLCGDTLGKCTRLGVAYGKTKKAFGITPRETMFLYGLHVCPNGSMIIWGKEMADTNDHLLPPGQRQTRANMNLFSVTLTPTGKDSFDVEYLLQLAVGGRVPNWVTCPMLVDTVKGLFEAARKECAVAAAVAQRPPVQEKVNAKRTPWHVQETVQAESHASWQNLLVPV